MHGANAASSSSDRLLLPLCQHRQEEELKEKDTGELWGVEGGGVAAVERRRLLKGLRKGAGIQKRELVKAGQDIEGEEKRRILKRVKRAEAKKKGRKTAKQKERTKVCTGQDERVTGHQQSYRQDTLIHT